MPTSYNGWAVSRNPATIGVNTRWEPVPGVRFPGGVKSGDVETVMTYLVRQLNARVEKAAEYAPGDDWGYSYRVNVNNPSVWSCHASATAIDYNATQHPNRRKYTWTREQAREIHRIIDDELAGVIRWLEGFDEMHFEIRGTPTQVAKVAKKIRDTPTTPAPTPTPPLRKVGDMFTYEYDAAGAAPNILVVVEGGKQVRITNATVTDRRRAATETHFGPVDETEFAGFAKAYGPVI